MHPTARGHAILATFFEAVKRREPSARRIAALLQWTIDVRALAEDDLGSVALGSYLPKAV